MGYMGEEWRKRGPLTVQPKPNPIAIAWEAKQGPRAVQDDVENLLTVPGLNLRPSVIQLIANP
jgi:hypothetical protein